MRKHTLHPHTAVINKKQKQKARQCRQKALAWLTLVFPQAFDNTLQLRPLKIGIMQDILEHANEAAKAGISVTKLREAVVMFTRRLDYLTCLKAREMRIDLQGTPVCEVTEEQAEQAASKIKRRIEKNLRNPRKPESVKTAAPTHSSPSEPRATPSFRSHERLVSEPCLRSSYSERSTGYSPEPRYATPAPRTSTAVVVTHKPQRQYDPQAIARLKEKLGLARREETA